MDVRAGQRREKEKQAGRPHAGALRRQILLGDAEELTSSISVLVNELFASTVPIRESLGALLFTSL